VPREWISIAILIMEALRQAVFYHLIPRELSIKYSAPESGPERFMRPGWEQKIIRKRVLIER